MTWSLASAGIGGSIGSTGLYTAPASGIGTDTVRATSGTATGTTTIGVSSSVPAAPTALTATPNSTSQITLGWTDNSSNETGFRIDRATDSNFTQNLISTTVAANTTSYADSNGLSSSTPYYYRVWSTNGSVLSATSSNTCSATTNNAPPTVATTAAASPSPVTGTTASLSVLGADDGGEANLKYSWAATSVPSGAAAPTFSAGGTNAAKNVTATFTKNGTYTFTATITDSGGLTVPSVVNVTVNQTLTSITVTPTGTTTLNENAQQPFGATGLDQFGNALASQPTFTWTSLGVGSVSSSGLYTAPAATGSATVTATSGSVSGPWL